MFVDVDAKINPPQARVDEIINRPQEDRLAAARAVLVELGAPAVEPAPLVDTAARGRRRPKLTGEAIAASKDAERARKREWMAKRRAAGGKARG
jgi:hypothetical protein